MRIMTLPIWWSCWEDVHEVLSPCQAQPSDGQIQVREVIMGWGMSSAWTMRSQKRRGFGEGVAPSGSIQTLREKCFGLGWLGGKDQGNWTNFLELPPVPSVNGGEGCTGAELDPAQRSWPSVGGWNIARTHCPPASSPAQPQSQRPCSRNKTPRPQSTGPWECVLHQRQAWD